MTQQTTPEITVIQPSTAHQIEGWAIEVYRKDAPNYAVVAIQRGSRVLSLRRNKCQAIFATPEAAIAAWNKIDWEVTIDKNGAVYRVVRRFFIGFHKHLLNTPAPVEVKPAPEAPTTAIVYRELDTIGAEVYLKSKSAQRAREMYYSHPAADSAEFEVKPATTSPALVETGERVIALPAQFRVIGNQTYRITRHGKVISVETLNPLCGAYEHEGNYINDFQVGNFLNRKRREWRADHPKSAPAITVKPAAPETYTVNRGNSVFRIIRDEGMGGRWLVEQWKSPRGTAEWFALPPCANDFQVDGMIGAIIPVAPQQPAAPAPEVTPDKPAHQPVQVDPRLTPPLVEALGVLFVVPSDVNPKHRAHVWSDKRKGIECHPADNFYRLPEKLAMGLVGLGYATRTNASAIIITPAGRAAYRAYIAVANERAHELVANYHKRDL